MVVQIVVLLFIFSFMLSCFACSLSLGMTILSRSVRRCRIDKCISTCRERDKINIFRKNKYIFHPLSNDSLICCFPQFRVAIDWKSNFVLSIFPPANTPKHPPYSAYSFLTYLISFHYNNFLFSSHEFSSLATEIFIGFGTIKLEFPAISIHKAFNFDVSLE